MKDAKIKTPCPKCRAMGHFGSATLNERGEGEVSVECDLCKGKGNITKRYFIEFTFTHIDKKYWLPIFFEANTLQKATLQSKRFEIGLKVKYLNVKETSPILYDFENESLISSIQSKYTNEQPKTLSVSTWKLKIEYDDSLSFMDNIYNYIPRSVNGSASIASLKKEESIPIRVIDQNLGTSNYQDYLAIDIT